MTELCKEGLENDGCGVADEKTTAEVMDVVAGAERCGTGQQQHWAQACVEHIGDGKRVQMGDQRVENLEQCGKEWEWCVAVGVAFFALLPLLLGTFAAPGKRERDTASPFAKPLDALHHQLGSASQRHEQMSQQPAIGHHRWTHQV